MMMARQHRTLGTYSSRSFQEIQRLGVGWESVVCGLTILIDNYLCFHFFFVY